MNTIRSRLLTSMVVTGLVPLVVVLVPLGTVLNRNIQQRERDKLSETSRQLGRLLGEVTDRTTRELATLQSNPFLSDTAGDLEAKIREMHRLVRIYEVYSDISLYDNDGFLLGSTSTDHPAFREYGEWFRKALGGDIVLSHPHRLIGKPGLYLTVYLPVESQGNRPAGSVAAKSKRGKAGRGFGNGQVIKASLSFARIIDLLDDANLQRDHRVYLLDSLGNLLSGVDQARLLEKFSSEIPTKRWFDVPVGTYTGADGVPYLYAREVIPAEVTKTDSPWIVVTMKPMNQVTAVIRQGLFTLIAAALLMMLVAGTLGVFLARVISRPLEKIGGVAASIAAGDLSVRADETEGSSETRGLASLFNRMVLELAEHREGLEKLVASRTESLHHSQADLERANARLHAAIESTNNGFLVEDLLGEIALVNDLFPALLGFKPGEAVSTEGILAAIAERGGFTRERAAAWIAKRAEGGVIDEEVVLSLPEKRVLDVYSSPIRDLRGNVVGRVWTAVDLTEQRQLEEEFRQSQKMEAVGQLAGGIAHDFNNLLAGILGNLALVKMELGEAQSDEARESLAHAIKAGERAADLVKQLLGFSRRSRLDLKPCDANLVLSEVRDILSATIDRRIHIELNLEPAPWRVMADVGMLGQVIMNMAVNAKDAMPKGGHLKLISGNRVLSAAELRSHPEIPPGEFLCLSVEDEGDGMPPEVQAKIFEPFFTTKEPGKGTGLGLATCFGIVKQLGGWIDFRSAPGEGTRFDIYLPRSAAAESGESAAVVAGPGSDPGLAPSRSGETILLVDDEALVRRIGRTLLTKLGYHVLEAADGLEALEMCRTRGDEIRLVLLDLTMPNLTGKETFGRIREIHPGLPVLICSGYLVDLDEFTRDYGACPDGFVQKPYRFEDMAEMVRETLDRQSHAA